MNAIAIQHSVPSAKPIRPAGAENKAASASRDDANKTVADNGATDKTAADKTAANKTADGSDFGTIASQMIAQTTQIGQQQPTDPTKPGSTEAGIPVLQSLVQNATQQAPDLAKLLLGLDDQTTTPAEDDAAAQFSEVLKTIQDGDHKTPQQPAAEKDGDKEAVSQTTTQTDAKNADAAEAVKQGHAGKNILDLLSKEKGDQDPFLRSVGSKNEGEAGAKNAEAFASTEPKTDFATLVQQERPATNAAPAAAEGTGRPVTPLHSADPTDVLDHAVSITKDGNRLAVQMDHGGLGKLDINLSLNKGVVNAQIQVANDATKNLIENNMQQIIHSLANEGLSVGGFSVALKQHQTWDGTGEDQKEAAGRSSTAYATPAISAVGATNAAQSRVNIFI